MQYIAQEAVIPLRAEAREGAEMVSQMLFGESCELIDDSHKDWWQVRLQPDGYEGWLTPKMLLPAENAQSQKFAFVMGGSLILEDDSSLRLPMGARIPQATNGPMGAFTISDKKWRPGADLRWIPQQDTDQLLALARCFRNTPYLWGGRSSFGIDCSGYTQLLYRLIGIELPRDSSQQAKQGEEVAFAEQAAGDLAFFGKAGTDRVTHVGIVDGQGHILHASGKVRQDKLSEQGIMPEGAKEPSHIFFFMRRYL
ncbi:MAG: C40 family peptidase [Bacteroidota bacterium]